MSSLRGPLFCLTEKVDIGAGGQKGTYVDRFFTFCSTQKRQTFEIFPPPEGTTLLGDRLSSLDCPKYVLTGLGPYSL